MDTEKKDLTWQLTDVIAETLPSDWLLDVQSTTGTSVTGSFSTSNNIYTTSNANTGIYSTTIVGAGSPWTIAPATTPSAKIELNGPDADIIVDGVSLMSTLKNIEQKINILRPNPELESEWDQLRELGDRYRQLERELSEKQKMWDTLRNTDPD